MVLRKAPPLPFLPAEMHGKEILVFAVCYAGEPAKAQEALAPLRALGEPIADVIGLQPYAAWQTAFDPLLTPGAYQLLEVAQFHGAQRRTARHAGRLYWHAANGGMRGVHRANSAVPVAA